MGFFYKMYKADHFIFLDDVPYSKGSFTARTFYRKYIDKQEKGYLTLPLQKYSLGTPINQILIDHSQKWSQHQLNQLFNTYRTAPYFEPGFQYIQNWMVVAPEFDKLADWNIYLLNEIRALLDIKTVTTRSSDLKAGGRQAEYLVELIRQVGGKTYLSGVGGKKYQDETLFEKAGISLRYINSYVQLESSTYTQTQGDWLNGLSMLDAFFNLGVDALRQFIVTIDRH